MPTGESVLRCDLTCSVNMDEQKTRQMSHYCTVAVNGLLKAFLSFMTTCREGVDMSTLRRWCRMAGWHDGNGYNVGCKNRVSVTYLHSADSAILQNWNLESAEHLILQNSPSRQNLCVHWHVLYSAPLKGSHCTPPSPNLSQCVAICLLPP